MSAAPACFRASDNLYNNCPPKMSDGRHFTDYRPQCTVNSLLNARNDITVGFQQRMMLTRNADAFMKDIRSYVYKQNVCLGCEQPYELGTAQPEDRAPGEGSAVPPPDYKCVDDASERRSYIVPGVPAPACNPTVRYKEPSINQHIPNNVCRA